MTFKLNALVATLVMAASAPALAAMEGPSSGNGELLLNMRYYNGAANSGANDISAVFDLGVTMDSFLANRNTAGFTQSWDLRAANYGTAFDTILAYVDAQGGSRANIEFNVIALDSTNFDLPGGHRYLTTTAVNKYPAINNSSLAGFENMNIYLDANNVRGTHATQANGASTAVQADGSAVNPVYFGSVNGGLGDTWRAQTTADTTAKVGVAQNFWFLTTTANSVDPTLVEGADPSSKTPFGFDVDGDGVIEVDNNDAAVDGVNEFGKWQFAVDATGPMGTVSFATPVPEAETYAMMLAGLGLVGYMVRRRRFA